MSEIGIAIIGTGKIALANHLPGLKLCPQAKLVALCDSDARTLADAARQTGLQPQQTSTDYQQILSRDEVDAVIVATPNVMHAPIVLRAIAAGKHVLCEKPLAMNLAEAKHMLDVAQAAGVVHMTAFTYRFVPAMRYMHDLIRRGAVGQPFHFRAQRFQDWSDNPLGWRQRKDLAATGEMGDMLSHRIDYAHLLLGPLARLVANLRQFVPTRGDQSADVDDWIGILADFRNGATAVFESTKLATGRGEGYRGQDVVEINGSEGTIVYSTQRPLELSIGKKGDADLSVVPVPPEFRVYPGSPRDPSAGDPLVTFRYDQDVEFIDAITNKRPATPSFADGVAVQAVMEAALQSAEQRRWVDVPYPLALP